MVLPQITDAASSWYSSVDLYGNYREMAMQKLETIQRKAAKPLQETLRPSQNRR